MGANNMNIHDFSFPNFKYNFIILLILANIICVIIYLLTFSLSRNASIDRLGDSMSKLYDFNYQSILLGILHIFLHFTIIYCMTVLSQETL